MLLKATGQWVRSPLGYNLLLSVLKGNSTTEKYLEIIKLMKKTRLCSVHTKMFVSSSCRSKEDIRKSIQIVDIEETDFTTDANTFSSWVTKNTNFKDVTKEITSETEFVLANIIIFQSNWPNSVPRMTIYNSFNYTQDVKYEARLLELPLKSEVKLVIVVPNEVDVVQSLFKTLAGQGLDAAVRSIQPLFTTTCECYPPKVDVTSSLVYGEKTSLLANTTTIQYGNLVVNEHGTNIKVMTCMYSPSNRQVSVDAVQGSEQPFYLAVLYHNVPLFIGQFTQ